VRIAAIHSSAETPSVLFSLHNLILTVLFVHTFLLSLGSQLLQLCLFILLQQLQQFLSRIHIAFCPFMLLDILEGSYLLEEDTLYQFLQLR
jgi:hypothetical protein